MLVNGPWTILIISAIPGCWAEGEGQVRVWVQARRGAVVGLGAGAAEREGGLARWRARVGWGTMAGVFTLKVRRTGLDAVMVHE
jgi:hypothetical protein